MKRSKTMLMVLTIMTFVLGRLAIAEMGSWWRPTSAPVYSMMGNMMRGMMGMRKGNKDRGENLCPMMGRMPARGIPEEDLPDPQSKGARLYADYCSQCHALPNPRAHSAEEWKGSFARMDARMQMMGRMKMMEMCRMMNVKAPNDEEKELILSYLQEHALKSIRKEELPAPSSEGAILFQETCSQCHDLPDPNLHTSDEWARVVDTMENYLNDLKELKQLTEKEKETIAKYLAENTKDTHGSGS